MTTFKPGDRVIINGRFWSNEPATVVEHPERFSPVLPGKVAVRLDTYNYTIEDDDHVVSESLLSRIEGGPTYYDFPGGVQVRDISAHLTSFGGQALQYVARATRLDGNNKGEAVKDLRKALDFIGWEIERLEAGND